MGTDLIIRSPPLDGAGERRMLEEKQLHETKKEVWSVSEEKSRMSDMRR